MTYAAMNSIKLLKTDNKDKNKLLKVDTRPCESNGTQMQWGNTNKPSLIFPYRKKEKSLKQLKDVMIMDGKHDCI